MTDFKIPVQFEYIWPFSNKVDSLMILILVGYKRAGLAVPNNIKQYVRYKWLGSCW